MRESIRRYVPFIFIFFLITFGVAVGYFLKGNVSYKNPDLAAEGEARMLAEEVGRLIILPTNEIPTIATVSDPAALKGQAFFVDAKVGDKVLIYSNVKKAILYDPMVKKVINIAPINTGDFQNKNKLLPSVTPETSFAVPNQF